MFDSSLGSSHHSDVDCALGNGGDQAHQSPNFTEQFNIQNEQIDCLAKENDELKTILLKLKVSFWVFGGLVVWFQTLHLNSATGVRFPPCV